MHDTWFIGDNVILFSMCTGYSEQWEEWNSFHRLQYQLQQGARSCKKRHYHCLGGGERTCKPLISYLSMSVLIFLSLCGLLLCIYTYKRVVCVCLFVGLSVCFLSATRHLSTLRRCLRVLREQPSRRGRPRTSAGKHAQRREHARAHAVQLLNEKIAALMPFKNKTVRARMLSYT